MILLRSRGRSIEGASGYGVGAPCEWKLSRAPSGLLTAVSLISDVMLTFPTPCGNLPGKFGGAGDVFDSVCTALVWLRHTKVTAKHC